MQKHVWDNRCVHPFLVLCPKKPCDLFWADLSVLYNDVCDMFLIISLFVCLLFDVLDVLYCHCERGSAFLLFFAPFFFIENQSI